MAPLSITVLTEEPTDLMILGFSFEFPMYRVDDVFGPEHFWYPISGDDTLPVATIN